MNKYLQEAAHGLKLAEYAMKLRVAQVEQLPKGIVIRGNQLAHARAVLQAIKHARYIAELGDDGWWDELLKDPF